jgi:hypothetical protein
VANFRRAKPRRRTCGGKVDIRAIERRIGEGRHDFHAHWPAHHDRTFHTPRRRAETKAELRRILIGRVDLDAGIFPTGNSRPHVYYW